MPMVEDLGAFFEEDEFATAAELDFLPVVGIFDSPSREVFDGMGTTAPRFLLPTRSAQRATHDSLLRIGDSRYRVRSVEPDGTGITVLTLELAT